MQHDEVPAQGSPSVPQVLVPVHTPPEQLLSQHSVAEVQDAPAALHTAAVEQVRLAGLQ